MGLANIFYCLKYETSLIIASYYSQGCGGDIRPRLHTGKLNCLSSSLYTSLGLPLQKTPFPNNFSIIIDVITSPLHRNRCRRYPFTKQLSSYNPVTVDGFTGRYQATRVPSRDLYVTTDIHATIFKNISIIGVLNCAFLPFFAVYNVILNI
jgi:hypothetical protein